MPNFSFFLINQDQYTRTYHDVELEATGIFYEFWQNKNYGKSIRWFRFDVYVEPIINYGRHKDLIYEGTAHLSAHIDHDVFTKASNELKVVLLLNASLVLLKYLHEKMVLPTGTDSLHILEDYNEFLLKKNLLLDAEKINTYIIKPFETTRFYFYTTKTIEVKKGTIHYDLNNIQDFLNNKLAGKTFGDSVREFVLAYGLFRFNGDFATAHRSSEHYKRYRLKHKELLVVKQFDYDLVKEMDKAEQFIDLKTNILQAIDDVSNMKRKPRSFKKDDFYEFIQNTLNEYETDLL